jgi:hypothetical protein
LGKVVIDDAVVTSIPVCVLEQRSAPTISATVACGADFISGRVIGCRDIEALYADLLVRGRREAIRADTARRLFAILYREWVLREVADRLVSRPTERILTGFTVSAVLALIRLGAVYTVAARWITELVSATDDAYAGVLFTILYRERVLWEVADRLISRPAARLITDFTVAAILALISLGAIYRCWAIAL